MYMDTPLTSTSLAFLTLELFTEKKSLLFVSFVHISSFFSHVINQNIKTFNPPFYPYCLFHLFISIVFFPRMINENIKTD